jgi:uncharacterized membrane protein
MDRLARTASPYAFSFFFIVAGALHFTHTQFYIQKIPAVIPFRAGLVITAGILEILLAILALFRRSRQFGSRAIMIFLGALVPVNLFHLLASGHQQGASSLLLWARLPFLAALSYWAYRNSKL